MSCSIPTPCCGLSATRRSWMHRRWPAASAWEISIKTRLGRLDGEALLSARTDILSDMSTSELPIESPDAILAGRLPWQHKDRSIASSSPRPFAAI